MNIIIKNRSYICNAKISYLIKSTLHAHACTKREIAYFISIVFLNYIYGSHINHVNYTHIYDQLYRDQIHSSTLRGSHAGSGASNRGLHLENSFDL